MPNSRAIRGPRLPTLRRVARVLFAAALVLPTGAVVGADPVRLFTTAEQRERLDRLRAEARAEPLADKAPREVVEQRAAARPPPDVTLEGLVRRSDGPAVVWVNGRSSLEGLDGRIRVDADRIDGDRVPVTLSDGRRLRLQPGQTWDAQSGTTRDVGAE